MAKTAAQLDRDIERARAKPLVGPRRSARQLDAEIAAALRGISRSQAYDSRNTSRNQVPALFKQVGWTSGTVNLDVGGGRYDRGTAYLADQGVTSLVFDPFNRSEAHNLAVLRRLTLKRADTATIANVLNVIKEGSVRAAVLRFAAKFTRPGGLVYIDVHEGDRSGRGRPTRDGYQTNLRAAAYLP